MFNLLIAQPEPIPVPKTFTVQELQDSYKSLPCYCPIIIKTKDGKMIIIRKK